MSFLFGRLNSVDLQKMGGLFAPPDFLFRCFKDFELHLSGVVHRDFHSL